MNSKALGVLKSFRPFFNFSFKNPQDVFCVTIGIAVWMVIISQAALRDITYDEAYSYLHTGRIQEVYKVVLFRIANTHILNSLLMSVSTLFFQYNDFMIRFPNVIFGFFYIFISLSISKNYKNRILVFSLLTLFHFAIEFMSLGRGYGMCVTLALSAIFVLNNKEKFKNYPLWIINLMLAAFYANYVAIVPAIILISYLFFIDLNKKIPSFSKRSWIQIIILTGIGLFGFLSVTKEGKPLVGRHDSNIFDITQEYIQLFWPSFEANTLIAITITLAFTLSVMVLLFFKSEAKYGVMTILIFTLILLLSKISGKPLPTHRVLIPFWPFIVLGIAEIADSVSSKVKSSVGLISTNIAVSIILVLNFYSQNELEELYDSKSEQWKLPFNSKDIYDKNITPNQQYYVLKDNYHDIIKNKLALENATQNSFTKDYSASYFEESNIIEYRFKKHLNNNSVNRTLLTGRDTIVSNNFSAKHLLYKDEDYYRLRIGVESSEANKVIITINNKWVESFTLNN